MGAARPPTVSLGSDMHQVDASAMKRERIRELPIYPEQRLCKRPTTDHRLLLAEDTLKVRWKACIEALDAANDLPLGIDDQ